MCTSEDRVISKEEVNATLGIADTWGTAVTESYWKQQCKLRATSDQHIERKKAPCDWEACPVHHYHYFVICLCCAAHPQRQR